MKTHTTLIKNFLLLAAGLSTLTPTSRAQTSAVANGLWSAPGTWSAGVPVNNANVGVGNGFTVDFQTGDSWTGGAATLSIGSVGSGILNISGGTLNGGPVGLSVALTTGTVNQSAGIFGASSFLNGGGTAAYNFTGGTFKANGNINMAANGITTNVTGATGGGSTFDTNGNTITVDAAQINLGAGGVLTKTGAGTLSILNNAYFNNGTWNINAGSVDTVGFYGAAVNVAGGTLNVARAGNHLSYATTTTNTLSSGAINATGDIYIGAGGGNGIMNQSGGIFTGSTTLFLAEGAGAATYNQTGGTLSVTNFSNGGGAAAYNFSGGTFKANGNINMAANGITTNVTGATGGGSTFDTNGNTITVDAAQINLGAGGVLTKTGAGTLSILNNAYFNNGTWNINAGSVDTVGFYGAAVNVAGGTLNVARLGNHLSYATTTTNTLSSGAINATNELYIGNAGGNGIMNQGGGSFTVSTTLFLGGAGGNGTYNQSGGALVVTDLQSAGGTNAYNFTGGTFKANGDISMAANGITTNVTGATGGGSTFDTNGNTITVNAAQLNLVPTGVLTKVGAGTLSILNDAPFAQGTWNVNAGTVTTEGYFAGANVNVAGGTLNLNRSIGNHFSYANASTTTFSAGTINTNADLFIGNDGASANGVMNQSGGTLAVTGNLVLGGSGGKGTYNQTGGSVTATGGMIVEANSTYNQTIGTMVLTSTATVANTGKLFINGTIGTTGVTVNAGGLLGGDGSINGNLSLLSGAKFQFSLTQTLNADSGTVTFGGLSIADIIGLDSSVPNDTYTLIGGTSTFNFANVSNFGINEAANLGGGKLAYFQPGSLQVVVIPEPSTWALLGLSLAMLLYVRRCRKVA